jgi:isopenicillin N synthase-like dioxygenase
MRNFDFRGYNPLYSAKNDAKALKPDAHEGFEFGYEDLETTNTENPGKPTNKIPNVWPDKGVLPNFREAMLEY